MKKKKPFVNKKDENVHVFKLGHRSQRDPLAADDAAPQHLLIPTKKQQKDKDSSQKEEERKYGIFYDDEYDYLQHVKDRNVVEHDWESADRFLMERNKSKASSGSELDPSTSSSKSLQLPSQVFASNQEEEVGLLNKAAPRSGPRLDWDPEIVETLDDDYQAEQVFTLKDLEKDEVEGAGAEDELDDFLAQAMESGDEDHDDDRDHDDVNSDFGGYGSEEDDSLGSLEGGFAFEDEETRSRFTKYSMSSSVIPRSENLALLDDRFEKV